MVEESPILEKYFILLLHTQDKSLERMLSKSVNVDEIRLERVESSASIDRQRSKDNIVTFIIGSDVEDPIQSAQRLHTIKKNARIVILATEEAKAENLREAIKFSPFIGVDVFCLVESDSTEFTAELNEIVEESLQAENYQALIAEANTQISQHTSSQATSFNQKFIGKLMDIAPIGIAIVGKKGNVLGWNKEAAFIFKENEAQSLGKPLSGFFENQEGKRLNKYLQQNFETNSAIALEALILEREQDDQSIQFLSFTAASFTYSEGDESAFILTIKNVTKQIQAEKELKVMNVTLEERVEKRTASLLAYQDQLRSLASQLSKTEELERQRLATELHDNLGQMLAVNKMKISALQNYQLPKDILADIENIKEGIDDALVYTRHLMSDLKPPPSLNREDIRASMDWLAKKMEKHKLKVTLEDDGDPKPVTDEIRTILIQCVRELLFNVIKHSGVNTANLNLYRTGNDVKIEVIDKGEGFDAETDGAYSREGGFGLFNINERIDLLGGSVDIESEPGKGTKVTVCAPLKDKSAEKEKDNNEDVSADDSGAKEEDNRIKVILVDDHQMMREGLKKIVNSEEDMTVIAEASDGVEALVIAGKTSPDIVVMDVNMPVMNGIDATQKLKEKMPDVRVIALSFHDHQDVIDSMRSAGATAYLTKNEAYQTLCAAIRSEAKLAKEG